MQNSVGILPASSSKNRSQHMQPSEIQSLLSKPIVLGVIAAFGLENRFFVNIEQPALSRLTCEQLITSDRPPQLGLGDSVLVCLIAEDRGIILGRIGATSAP